MSNLTERKLGTTTASEEVRSVLKAETLPQLNNEYAEEVAKVMLNRWEQSNKSDPNEKAFIWGAFGAKKDGFRSLFKIIAEKQGWKDWEADDATIERAWIKNVVPIAERRYEELRQVAERERMRAAAPPLPSENASEPQESVYEVEPILDAEIAPEAVIEIPETLRPGHWAEWGSIPLSTESLGKFNNAFVPELGKVVNSLTPAQLETIKGIYTDIVFNMYVGAQPKGSDLQSLLLDFKRALPSYWKSTLDSARLFAPIR